MSATHVTIAPDGSAERIPEAVRERLRSQSQPVPNDEPQRVANGKERYPEIRAFEPANATFSSEFRVRTPHLEAADLGYFEEYFRFMAIALEEYLGAGESPMGVTRDRERLLQPSRWSVTFSDTSPFRSSIAVRGNVQQQHPDRLVVQYRLDESGKTNIEGAFEYVYWTPDGQRDREADVT